jgi:hypothetical protein
MHGIRTRTKMNYTYFSPENKKLQLFSTNHVGSFNGKSLLSILLLNKEQNVHLEHTVSYTIINAVTIMSCPAGIAQKAGLLAVEIGFPVKVSGSSLSVVHLYSCSPSNAL